MHGVKRSRIPPVADSAEVERKRREKQLEAIAHYTDLVDQLQARMAANDHSQESLDLTTKILGMNPEYHTGWSQRRTILLQGPLNEADAEARQRVLEHDLDLTNSSLRLNPKNYSVWEHRKWVLETMPDADWALEIKIVEMFLEKDGPTVHSWDYRRYLIESIQSIRNRQEDSVRTKPLPNPTTESELNFTTRKISSNFSNFSAWHYRTKLLAKLWHEKGWDEDHQDRRNRIDQEFDLVKQAIWSDPNDQSAWLYHRWLVGTGSIALVRREIAGIEELLEEEPDSRWCLDSLVHYKRLLVQLLSAEKGQDGEAGPRAEQERLRLECKEMLDRLIQVDPMRANRYRDISLQIIPARR
ncbi:Rab geranylgeranyltransferase BET4 [Sporobolomyces koalae]|uniref:Rab geranylgeranyltransferase BET4 n=1 Tax=Sporobolomyces koalae TaxID=500713 RepID=UPI00316C6630